jgi:hypothetical protein
MHISHDMQGASSLVSLEFTNAQHLGTWTGLHRAKSNFGEF